MLGTSGFFTLCHHLRDEAKQVITPALTRPRTVKHSDFRWYTDPGGNYEQAARLSLNAGDDLFLHISTYQRHCRLIGQVPI